MAKQHRSSIEGIVLGSDEVRFADPIPIETGIEYGLEKISIGEVVGPLALPLEARQNRIMAESFLFSPLSAEIWIANH